MNIKVVVGAVLIGLLVSGCSQKNAPSKVDLIAYEACINEYLKSGKYNYLKPEYELSVIQQACKTFLGEGLK